MLIPRRDLKVDQKKGKCCVDCGIYFKIEHGHEVICSSCAKWRKVKGLPIDVPITYAREIEVEDLTLDEIAKILFNGKQGEMRRGKNHA